MMAVLGLMVAMVAPAAAQDQTVTIDPQSVAEAGEATVTVSGSGFTEPGFVLPCPGANGDPTALSEDSCDLASLTPFSPTDGEFTLEVTYDVPAEGLVVVAGNAAQTEVGANVILVGAPAAEATAADTLPETGAESWMFLVVGAAVLAGGLMVLRFRNELV